MGSIRHMKRHFALFLINHFFSGNHFWGIKRALLRFSGASVGDNTKVVGPIYYTCKMSIGSNCWIGLGLEAHGNGSVSIGNNCDLGPDVMLLTGSHEIGTAERRAGAGKAFSIKIEDGCWLGARSTVLGDTTVKKASVVASCALVNKDVDENTVVGGVPAKQLKELN